MFGCSMERDWYRRRAADLVEAYIERVGAGTTAAREERRIEGDEEMFDNI